MEPQFLNRCRQLVAERMGMQMREHDVRHFQQTLIKRIAALKLARDEDYYLLLTRPGHDSDVEWKQLYILLTNQESYFFRDQGQFDLLRATILPELIERASKRRTLRIWSAGCSTGEEAYSLAILVDQLLAGRDGWKVQIFGTDLSDAALEKARAGQYGTWSFRMTDDATRERYFKKNQTKYQIGESIRQRVDFSHLNLIADTFPSKVSGLFDIDLILCRNVFIYFERAAVTSVIRKFSDTLSEGGYLMTGHAELHDSPLSGLQVRSFPMTVLYQKGGAAVSPPVAKAEETTRATIASSARPKIERLPARPAPVRPVPPASKSGARTIAAASPEDKPAKVEELCLQAMRHADRGEYELAARLCADASLIDNGAPRPYYILARVSEEQGDTGKAKTLLKKVIYLAPEMLAAYVELASIYAAEGDAARAATMKKSALEIVAKLDPTGIATPELTGFDVSWPIDELVKHLS